MNIQQKLLIALVRHGLFRPQENLMPEENVDWLALFDESKWQGVAAIVYCALNSPDVMVRVPESINNIWKSAARTIGLRYYSLCEELRNVIGLLEENNIEYTVLKGIAASRNYPKPECRTQSDIDLYIGIDKRNDVHNVMIKNGFNIYPLVDHPCHDVYSKDGLLYEMHFEVSGLPDGERSILLRPFMAEMNSYSMNVVCNDLCIKVPDIIREAIVILLHLHHHMMGEGIGIRHICDYFCYINAQMTGDNWQMLLDRLEVFGLKKFAYILAVMGIYQFGLEMPYFKIENKEDITLAADLLEDILQSGMFGIKDKERKNSSKLISDHGKTGTDEPLIGRLCRILVSNTYALYPNSQKNRSVFSFCFVATLIRQAYRLISGKTAISKQTIQSAKVRRNLYAKLKVFD